MRAEARRDQWPVVNRPVLALFLGVEAIATAKTFDPSGRVDNPLLAREERVTFVA